MVLWPKLSALLRDYPDIRVEIAIDYRFTDIVSERYDAGVHLGEQLEKNMIAVRIGPDMRMAVVGSPTYFARRSKPQPPRDLSDHDGINFRLPTLGGLLPWEFEKEGQELKTTVDGQWVFNNARSVVRAAVAGFGLGTCRRIWLKSSAIYQLQKDFGFSGKAVTGVSANGSLVTELNLP
ncbi:hypothetical protein EZI54_21365 [Marinobacter halodurans]|uniref:LysR substrate-binding domain-containing protein n=1 Tax=Marinobacter halodurans TaxID=2528979 RepID=A0ABY1ZH37_9GAMM|nr:LysR substrate-binding domain-containing protein [Marinobacter halodurans]TBW48302.1 hypothetical protein EZI54_21365 [Marinobacter halodurans]